MRSVRGEPDEDLDRHRLDQRRPLREARRHRRRRLRRRRDLRGRPAHLRRHPGRGRPHGPRRRPRAHPLPAVPRLRGHARAAARPRLRPRRAQVRPDGRARRRPDPRLLQHLRRSRSAASTAPPPTCASSGSAPRPAASASASRPSPGAATSATTATPGRSSAAPTTPRVGLILDSFHTLSRGLDPDSIRSIPADKLFLVQLADAPAFEMDLLQWSRHYRNMPGEGDLPVTRLPRRRRRHRLRRLALARDLQRPVPRRLAALDLRRRPPLARRPDGPGPARRARRPR